MMSGGPGAGEGPRTSHLSILSHKLTHHGKLSALVFLINFGSFLTKLDLCQKLLGLIPASLPCFWHTTCFIALLMLGLNA